MKTAVKWALRGTGVFVALMGGTYAVQMSESSAAVYIAVVAGTVWHWFWHLGEEASRD